MGGIRTGLDALEFVLAGANAVSVGTAVFGDPSAPIRVLDELARALVERGFTRFEDAIGAGPPAAGRASCPRGPTRSATSCRRRRRGDRADGARPRARSRSRSTRPTSRRAARWAQAVTPHVSVVKVGLELFCRDRPVGRRDRPRRQRGATCSSTSSCTTSPTRSARRAKAVARLQAALPHRARQRRRRHGAGRRRGGARGDHRRRHRAHQPVRRAASTRSAWPARRWTPYAGWLLSPSVPVPARSCAARRRSPRCAPRSVRASCSSPLACARRAPTLQDQARVATPAAGAGRRRRPAGHRPAHHRRCRPGCGRRRDRRLARLRLTRRRACPWGCDSLRSRSSAPIMHERYLVALPPLTPEQRSCCPGEGRRGAQGQGRAEGPAEVAATPAWPTCSTAARSTRPSAR